MKKVIEKIREKMSKELIISLKEKIKKYVWLCWGLVFNNEIVAQQ